MKIVPISQLDYSSQLAVSSLRDINEASTPIHQHFLSLVITDQPNQAGTHNKFALLASRDEKHLRTSEP